MCDAAMIGPRAKPESESDERRNGYSLPDSAVGGSGEASSLIAATQAAVEPAEGRVPSWLECHSNGSWARSCCALAAGSGSGGLL